MIAGLCESPLTFQAIIIWRDELNEGKTLLRDIIDLEATYSGPEAKAAPQFRAGKDRGKTARSPRKRKRRAPLKAKSDESPMLAARASPTTMTTTTMTRTISRSPPWKPN
jgi:RNA polymerase primary sigma factor